MDNETEQVHSIKFLFCCRLRFATAASSLHRPTSVLSHFSNHQFCNYKFLCMENDTNFNVFINFSLAELDDPERFWKCWRLNDCGTCLNKGDRCGWCPYVRRESSIHWNFDSSSDLRVVSVQLKHTYVFIFLASTLLDKTHTSISTTLASHILFSGFPCSNALTSSPQLVSFCPKAVTSFPPSVIPTSVPSPGRSAGNFALNHSVAIVQLRHFWPL